MPELTLEDRIGALSCPVDHTMLDPVIQDDPWDFYQELHEQCPVFPMPEIGAVMVTRYEDVRYVLTNPDLFSSSGRGGGAKKGLQVDNARRYQEILRERGWGHVETLQRTDPPIHTDYRRLVAKAFLPRRIADMAPHIDDVTRTLIDGLIDRGECEFNLDFAMPLPGIIIAEELGLDSSEIHRFNRWAGAMLALAMRPLTDAEVLETVEIELEAQHHLAAVFEARRTDPTDDLISTLVHAHEDEDGVEPLTVAELQNLMHQLVTGGFETTTSALNHGMWLLTRYPDVQERVRRDLSLIPRFIEEVLRYESPVQGLARRATPRRRSRWGGDPRGLDGDDPLRRRQPRRLGVRTRRHLRHRPAPHTAAPRVRCRPALLRGQCTGPPGTRQRVHAVVGAHLVDRAGPGTRRPGPRAELHPVPDEGTPAALRAGLIGPA